MKQLIRRNHNDILFQWVCNRAYPLFLYSSTCVYVEKYYDMEEAVSKKFLRYNYHIINNSFWGGGNSKFNQVSNGVLYNSNQI